MKSRALTCFSLAISLAYSQQVEVDINLNISHSVDSYSPVFDRAKYINLHATSLENDFFNNLSLLGDFMEDNDVYLGRDAGIQNFQLSQTAEDPQNPGFPSAANMQSRGSFFRQNYAANTMIHPFEARQESSIITSISSPFFPGSGVVSNGGWTIASADATGIWWRDFLTNFFGAGTTTGLPKPKFLEIMNEPILELILLHDPALATRTDIYEYHNTVAARVREEHEDIMIGGFAHALRNLEDDNFTQWQQTWENFLTIAGENMDFLSLHLYDSPFEPFETNQFLREGGNAEATLDLIENGSQVILGEVKPIIISEYGSFISSYNEDPYTQARDWTNLKAFNSMLMGFLERPNVLLKTVPFMLIEAEFFRGQGDPNDPYPYRLLRRDPDDGSGSLAFTEFVRFYELWADVNGTRVESRSSDLDIQVDAYVDGNKAYVILNNLQFESQLVNLNFFGVSGNSITDVRVKHLRFDPIADTPQLDILNVTNQPDFVLESESTAILEYSFTSPIIVDETCNEVKTYAHQYVQAIVAGEPLSFNVNSGTIPALGEAVLRVGIGRAHADSKLPVILFNGKQVLAETDFRGYDQLPRPNFFGLLEVSIPFELVRERNVVTTIFPDSGGRVSSVALQLFDFSVLPGRSGSLYGAGAGSSPLVVPKPSFFAEMGMDQFGLEWQSESDHSYLVEESTDLENWEAITGFLSGGSSSTQNLSISATVPEYFTRIATTNFPRPTGVSAAQADFDSDGFTNDEELALGTSPFFPNTGDSDGDSVPDAFELRVIAASSADQWERVDQINASNAVQAGSETGQGAPGVGLTDFVSLEFAPTTLPVGRVYPVQVRYSATTNRDIVVAFRDMSPNIWLGESRLTIPAGEGVAIIYVNILDAANNFAPMDTTPGNDYFFRGDIRPVGGDFSTIINGFSDSAVVTVE